MTVPLRIALVAASLATPGGQGVQAALLVDAFRRGGQQVRFVPTAVPFPRGPRWLGRFPGARPVLSEILSLAGLWPLAGAEGVHVFSASYGSFLHAPVPAMIAGRLLGKRVVLHYHSGEAATHLR